MDAYTIFRNECIEQGETIGEERGFIKGQSEGINESIKSLANFFLNEKDNTLTKEEAYQKAKEILEPK